MPGQSGFALDRDEIADAVAASNIGIWDWDVLADRCRICPATAALFGITAEEIAFGPPLARFMRAVHVEDRDIFGKTIDNVTRQGGLFVAEYRTVPDRGRINWVLARGQFDTDARGIVVRGRGIVVDITDFKVEGYGDGRALFSETSEAPLDRVAGAALAAWAAVDDLAPAERKKLKPTLSAFLHVVGRMLARQISTAARPFLHS